MAARIAGVNIPMNKHAVIALRAIYGIGPTLSKEICNLSGIKKETPVKDLADTEIENIRSVLKNLSDGTETSLPYKDEGIPYLFEGSLSRDVKVNINRLKDIGCYRGKRHRSRLPLRGQNTKNNAKTCKRSRRS